MEKAASQASIAFSKLNPSFVSVKASSFPLDCAITGSHGPNISWQQIHGSVEIIEHRPRYLPRENRKHIVDPEGQLQSPTQIRTET